MHWLRIYPPGLALVPILATSWPHLHISNCRGGTFLQSLVLQAFSDVMVIIDDVSNLQSGQFANSAPHPAILLLTHPIKSDFQKSSSPYVVGCLSRGLGGTSSKKLGKLNFVEPFRRKVSKTMFYFRFKDSCPITWFLRLFS